MSRRRRWLIGVLIAIWLLPLAVYLINPFGTATWDPRARIVGHVPYRIPAASMHPALQVGDLIFARTYVYAASPPQRHDVIVFRYPGDRSIEFVKRVAALGGERVAIRAGVLLVDGRPVDEPYVLSEQRTSDYSRTMRETRVPPGHVFVLGDNRDNSHDSRFWGPVPLADVVGRAHYIFLAEDIARIGRIGHGE